MIIYLTIAEVAKQIGISRQAVHKAMKQGRINATRKYGIWLISTREAARWKHKRAQKEV